MHKQNILWYANEQVYLIRLYAADIAEIYTMIAEQYIYIYINIYCIILQGYDALRIEVTRAGWMKSLMRLRSGALGLGKPERPQQREDYLNI